MNKAKEGDLGSIVFLFLSHVDYARDSIDKDLQFATSGSYYPDTISGLMKLGIRRVRSKKSKGGKNYN